MSVAGNDDSLNIDLTSFWEIMNEESPQLAQQTKKSRQRLPKKKDKQASPAAERNIFQTVVLQQAPRPPPASFSLSKASETNRPYTVHTVNDGEGEDVKPFFTYPSYTQTNASAVSPSTFHFTTDMTYLNADRQHPKVAVSQERLQSSPASVSSSKASQGSNTKRPREVQTVEDDVAKDIKLTFPASCSIQTNASAASLDNFLFPADMDYLNAAGPSKALDWGILHTAQALQTQLFTKREFQALDSKYKNLQSMYDQMVKSEKVATARREVLEAELAKAQSELFLSKKQKSLAELELEASKNEVARLKKELNKNVDEVEKTSHDDTILDNVTVMHEGKAGDTAMEDDGCVTVASYAEPKEVEGVAAEKAAHYVKAD